MLIRKTFRVAPMTRQGENADNLLIMKEIMSSPIFGISLVSLVLSCNLTSCGKKTTTTDDHDLLVIRGVDPVHRSLC